MRIHLQSKTTGHDFPLSQAVWDAASARSPDVSAGHEVSFAADEAGFAAALPTMEVLIAQSSALTATIPLQALRLAPHLKLILVTSAGLDRLAPYDWLPPGAVLLNNRGTHAVKAGEYGLMALLMLACRMPELMTAQREGRWVPAHGSVLAGQRVVVVGLGSLGGSTASHARAFGMHVTGVRATATPHEACHTVLSMDQLDSALHGADYLVLAPPLTPATRGLLSRERIARLPRGARLVNIGRGGLVDQDALLDALDSGHLGGAVLDVFTPEPVPPGHRLWSTPNLIITPHVSADDPNTYNDRTMDIFFENLRALRDGAPLPNRFDLDRGY